MLLWHKDYFELIIFEKWQTGGTLWAQSRGRPFVRDIYTYKGTLHL